MLDRSIPFYNVIMRCSQYKYKNICVPDGYEITPYCCGDEKGWARLEYAVGDFDSVQEAEKYFVNTYLNNGDTQDIFFLKDISGNVIGSCIAWTDQRGEALVNSLHWLIVEEESRKRGFGRALCETVMNRFCVKNGSTIYIHTQPWSFAAIFLYLSEGFKLTKNDTFAAYVNQYTKAMETLKRMATSKQYELLVNSSEE